MNFVFFISGSVSGSYGGGQIYIQNLLKGFESKGDKISVLSIVQGSAVVKEYNWHGHDIYEIGGSQEQQQDTADELIKKIDPDVIHAHGAKVLALELAEKYHIPCVVTAHHGGIICPAGACLDYDDHICTKEICDKNCLRCVCRNIRGYMLWYVLLRCIPLQWRLSLAKYVRKLPFIPFVTPVFTCSAGIESKQETIKHLQQTAAIISPCHKMESMLRNNGVDKNVVVVPHGIPELPHSPLPEIDNGKIRFFFIGRICYVKGLHVMLRAFQGINSSKYELHIIGEAANKQERRYERKLKEKYHNLPLVWHGKIPHEEILSAIKECHVMIHPAISLEIYGLTIAESLSIGRPVLATRCGGAEMQIQDNSNGWLIPPNDVQALQNKISELLANPKMIIACAQNCHVDKFQEHIDHLLALYRTIVNNEETRSH